MKLELDLPDYEFLHPEIQRGLVEMVQGACAVLVTAKRGKYPDDPALGQTVEEHLDHAEVHISTASFASEDDAFCGGYPDGGEHHHLDNDGHPHMHHCTARVVLAIARMWRVGGT